MLPCLADPDAKPGEVSAKEIVRKAGCTGRFALSVAFLWDSILQGDRQRGLPMHSSTMLSFATSGALLRGDNKYCSRNESKIISPAAVS
jgi:hypothetical protein